MAPNRFLMLRDALKTAIERSVVLSGITAMSRIRRRGEVLILAYHNIVPAGEQRVGDTSLHLPQEAFAQQLEMLRETHDIVPLSEVIEAHRLLGLLAADETSTPESVGEVIPAHSPNASSKVRPRAVITFDDAYRGSLTAGLTELRQRELPATVFVAPAYVGGKSFWWDMITSPDAPGIDDLRRERALTVDAGKGTKILDRIRNTAPQELARMPAYAQCVTEDELRDALEYEHLTLGSHSWSHPNLTQLNSKELTYELRAPQQWLTERFADRVLPAISYPYGRANPNVWKATADAGYEMGLMIDGGWATIPIPSPYAVPRLNIPSGVSIHGFALRASGILTT